MNYKIKILVLITLLGLTANAQNQPTKNKALLFKAIKGLKIGDKVPAIPMTKIVLTDGSIISANTSDFNDRLLILDFMYTSCSSCIAGLPKKDHLQRQFADKIKVIVVVGGELYSPGMLKRENADYIKKFLTNKNSFLSRNNVRIPWVVENKLLNQYFPHQLVSHLVWIYKGNLVAITEQDYVTAENIQAILDGKKNKMPVKNDFSPPVDIKTTLACQDKTSFTGDKPLHRQVAIYGCYQDGIVTKMGIEKDSINKTRRDYIINLPIINIYTSSWNTAIGDPKFLSPSSIILEVKNSSKYTRQADSSEYDYIRRNKTYICYESIAPDTGQTDQQVALSVIKDLNYLLGLNGRYEKRKTKCLALIRTDTTDRFKSKKGDTEGFSNLKTPFIKISNNNLNDIVWKLNQFYGNPPVFNETGYKNNVDIEFNLNSWQNIPALRHQLQNYGLDLKEEVRELEVFILTETDQL